MLTEAEIRTQQAADYVFGAGPGPLWTVQLPDHPLIRLRAVNKDEALRHYDWLCGITFTHLTHNVGLVEEEQS